MIQTLLNSFQPISLADLDNLARLMRRTDNKYVISEEQLHDFLLANESNYYALCIDDIRKFKYSNVYLDSPDYDTFLDHNKGRRRRFKIRFRHYHEADLYYFEVKLKGFRNETIKYRLKTNKESYDALVLPANLYSFADTHIATHYGRNLEYPLNRALRVDYERITLVSKAGGERITIDNNIEYFNASEKQQLRNNYYIIETKSKLGRAEIDRWLNQNKTHAVKGCSKYCMGLNLLELPNRNSKFKPVLRRKFHHYKSINC